MTTPTCPRCGGAHEFHNCKDILAAFGPDPAPSRDETNPEKYRGRRPNRLGCVSPRKLAGLCAREGCGEARWHGTPYCHEHRREVCRIAEARRKERANDPVMKRAHATGKAEFLNLNTVKQEWID